MIKADKIQELKQKTNLIHLFESYGHKPIKKGKTYLVLCPFHQENTPSLSINEKAKLWNCFGCKEGGDAIKFVQRIENLSFLEAVKRLADLNGISEQTFQVETLSPKLTSSQIQTQSEMTDQELLNKVMDFYHRVFMELKEGKNYLKSRGITKSELYETYKIGFSDGNLLKSFPEDHQIKTQLQRLGILLDSGKERFLNCVIFPLFNEAGDIVSFYGRHVQISHGGHFYIPGPRQGLFNCRQLKETQHSVIITESIIDAMSFIEKEMENVMAMYGTNGFTEEHKKLIEELKPKEIILALDGDETGLKASADLKEKLQQMLQSAPGFETVLFPDNQDANEYFLRHSKDDFYRLLPVKESVKNSEEQKLNSEEQQKSNPEPEKFSLTQKYQLKYAELKAGKLNITVRVDHPATKKFHLDSYNLYNERQRQQLVEKVSELLNEKKEAIADEIEELIVIAEKKSQDPAEKNKANSPEENQESKSDEMSEEEKAEALSFLKSQDLLNKIVKDYEEIGYIGEEINKKLAYLVMTSRKLCNPLSLVIMSNSAAGKSSLQKATLEFCPEAESSHFTRITQQSLYYLGADAIKHKFISIEEEEGSSEATYSLKTMLSDKQLIVVSTGQDQQTGKKKSDVYKTEGPMAVMVSTTSSDLDSELGSRTLIISIDESRNHTSKIHDKQRLNRTLAGREQNQKKEKITKKHQNSQNLLDSTLEVINNFADKLTFPTERLNFRRGHEHYLDLIDTIAFLRQHQKEIKQSSALTRYIEVEKEDIKTANEICISTMGWTIDELKPPAKKLLKQIQEFCEESGRVRFFAREIREKYHWDNVTLHRHLKTLIELEYLQIIHHGANGSRNWYELIFHGVVDSGDKFIIGLKNPDEL